MFSNVKKLKKIKVSPRRIFLLTLNVASTLLTLITGLRENPLIVFAMGRYDGIRARMRDGHLSYDIVPDDILDVSKMPDLVDAADAFRFISAPRRSPANLGEDRSTCMRVNAHRAPMMTLNFDDFWGKGARRIQVFAFSISARHCEVVNLLPAYVTSCIETHGNNATACHQFILEHFNELQTYHEIQTQAETDFGAPGKPFLKCKSRPPKPFDFEMDLMVQQSYWAGGSYHIEVQTSSCRAQPLLQDDHWTWELFQVESLDQAANVVIALPHSGLFARIVSYAYGFVTIVMIIQGVLAALIRSRRVQYLPQELRRTKEHRVARVIAPFMPIMALLAENENSVITFKGTVVMASDVWMNHWLYITLSILDAITSIRTTYVVLQTGTWMLKKKAAMENFIFLCGALTRITWLMCFLHTVIRLSLKLLLRSIKSMRIMRSSVRERIEWYIDGTALFLSYKIYNLLLCILLYLTLKIHGSTSLMKQQAVYKQGNYGGSLNIARFWGSEIACDLFIILSMLTLSGLIIGLALMRTKYRYLANSGVMRMLQDRYVFVGWDALTAAQMLKMDPYVPLHVDNDIALTGCSIGTLLQLFYASGPSGLVQLAGDYLFVDGGFSREVVKFRYPVKRAADMGLCATSRASAYRRDVDESSAVSPLRTAGKKLESNSNPETEQRAFSLFDRRLRLCTEGALGRILLIDVNHPGVIVKNPENGQREYEVRDALSFMTILDIKPLLQYKKRLRFE
ncbi:hypothetical protein Poli38472_004509 [Pythium oligandrum]|uniref:Uncharacterized protein n=1 Tax=Pythium oligandrum TaxID=41045 RepID=A0A8K1CAE0_PYTOL|nr:hypothetical protein Poli38472_004509 [Pythium oligandrum]|eukprot:TMW59440.1 hypothetical protein Poli38472_004509 [Pythium oligandrum]